jgi:hypothetical protein
MTEYERARPRGVAERAYRALLMLYPPDFRDELGDAMVEFFRDRLRDARARHGAAGAAWLWLRVLGDTLRNALPARIDSLARRWRRAQGARAAARDSHITRDLRRKDWMMSSVLQDVRYALRAMLAARGFTAVVLLTLMLGIGANAAIFSVVNSVLLRPLPYADPDRLVSIVHHDDYSSVSEPEFADYKRDSRTFERLTAWASGAGSLTGDGEEPEVAQAARVSDGFFTVLGVSPQLGRAFLPEEDTPTGPVVVILSHGLWQRRFGGDPGIIGKDVVINGSPRTVVGVMPPRFEYPSKEVAFWVPLRLDFDSLWTRNNHYLQMLGRLAPDASRARGAHVGRLPRCVRARLTTRAEDHSRRGRAPREDPSVSLCAARRSRIRAADRVRQRRQPPARAR